MITRLSIENFKSWRKAELEMAPLTGLFGTNSSGKTSILQLLLLLKQTAESADRRQVLNMGDMQSYARLGSFSHIVHGRKLPGCIGFAVDWQLPQPLSLDIPKNGAATDIDKLMFAAHICQQRLDEPARVSEFSYSFGNSSFGMQQVNDEAGGYAFIQPGKELKYTRGRKPETLASPVKFYGFPEQVYTHYQHSSFLADMVLAFQNLFQSVYYLGPLRDYPQSSYVWSGEQPENVGDRGQKAVQAMLASRQQEKINIGPGRGRRSQTKEERVAWWLKELGLVYDFSIEAIAKGSTQYEVYVQLSPDAPKVLITDVGFGVSQILPVLVLCFYAPRGSIIILEQPEIHLHPAVQAGLADVFIDAIKLQGVQIIVESHSEHLLRRLQRRVAEETLTANGGGFTSNLAKLYFCQRNDQLGESELIPLELNLLGDIPNWPKGFFGDITGDLAAKARAGIELLQRGKVV